MSDEEAPIRIRRSAGSLLLELAMIGIGVFLGASAEQWRDNRHHKDLAKASLQNFRREVTANRARVEAVREYHTQLAEGTGAYLEGPGPRGFPGLFATLKWHGIAPPDLERTAWDLALATQALSDISPSLAYAISHVYSVQQSFGVMQTSFATAAFSPATFANPQNAMPFAIALSSYLGDVNIQEPRLMRLYNRLLPQIDSALGGPPRKTESAAAKTPKTDSATRKTK